MVAISNINIWWITLIIAILGNKIVKVNLRWQITTAVQAT